MESLRVLVAEASSTYMEAIRQVLAGSPRLVLAAEASTGSEALGQALQVQPDIALVDVHLPGRNGLAVARQLKQEIPDLEVVVLLSDDNESYRLAVAKAGARWAAKDRLAEELPGLVQSSARPGASWAIPQGGVSVDNAKVDLRFGRYQTAHAARASARDWAKCLVRATKPALLVFFVGAVLLGLTAFLSWDLHTPVARSSAGDAWIVDELGMFGEADAVVRLSKDQTDRYVATQISHHRGSLLLCLAIGMLGLIAGSAGIAWYEFKEEQRARGRPATT